MPRARIEISWRASALSDDGNRYLESWNLDWQLCALSCWRIDGKPSHPLLIHTGKIIFFRQHDRRTHDLVQRTAGFCKDCRDILQALLRLCLNRRAPNL